MSRGGSADGPDVVPVEAAGGVVWRFDPLSQSEDSASDKVEIAVVHRPRRADWSLPKGHLEVGESFLDAAVREVVEETGLRCEVGNDLGEISYVDHRGRSKVVRYWAMQAVAGRFVPNDEVDELRWLEVQAACSLLTYDSDRTVLGRFSARSDHESRPVDR